MAKFDGPLTEEKRDLLKAVKLSDRDRLHVSLDDKAVNFVLTMWSEWQNGTKASCSGHMRNTFCGRFPQHKHLEHIAYPLAKCVVPMSDITAQLIAANFAERSSQIYFDDDARRCFDYLVATIFNQNRCCEFIANFRAGNAIRTSLLANTQLMPAPYQLVGAQCALWSEGYGLFMEQGTGKTCTSIVMACTDAVNRLPALGRPYRGVIVCPRGVRMGWQDEFSRFKPAGVNVQCTVIRGEKMDRAKRIIDALYILPPDTHATMLIMSYEAMSSMMDTLKAIPGGFELGLLDESHNIRNPETKRSKSAMQLRELCTKRMCLSGTPIVNTINDLYAQLEFLGQGFSGFTTFPAFREFHNVFRIDEQGHRAMVAAQNVPFMRERLAKLSYLIRKAEALPDLPEKLYDICEVEMLPEQKSAYEQLATDMAVEIEGELAELESGNMNGHDRAMTANNILTRMLRLAQITAGFRRWDDVFNPATGELVRKGWCEQFDPNPKVDGCIELFKTYEPWEKLIIWANWSEDIRAICERLDAEGIKHCRYQGVMSDNAREEAKRLFNYEPEYRICVGNAAAGGAGLNLIGCPPEAPHSLPTACTHEYYFSQGWSPVLRSQSEDRAHRKGTKFPVTVTDFCVPNSIDAVIRERVLQKRIAAYDISDVREILHAVLNGIKLGVGG